MTASAIDTPAHAALRAIGWPHAGDVPDGPWREAMAAHPQAAPARVVEQHRTGYLVAQAPEHSSISSSFKCGIVDLRHNLCSK